MKHVGWLLDDAIESLISIFMHMEYYLLVPDLQEEIFMVFIHKAGPAGGRRPIGLFCALVRLWTRVRRPLIRHWEMT